MRKPYSEAFPICIKGYLANRKIAKKGMVAENFILVSYLIKEE
ncbi:MAG: hypothetical protein RR770_08150 [Bacteroidales bacterium]